MHLSVEVVLFIINRNALHLPVINNLERESIKMILNRDFGVYGFIHQEKDEYWLGLMAIYAAVA